MSGSGTDPGFIRLVESHAAAGRSLLSEPEVYALLRVLGIGVPEHAVVPVDPDGTVPRPPGDRAVIKVVSAGVTHKAAEGGVVIVPNTDAAVGKAVAEVAERFGTRASGILVAEHIEHGAEYLIGLRWTGAFGPIVTVGRGGSGVEELGEPAVLSLGDVEHLMPLIAAAPGVDLDSAEWLAGVAATLLRAGDAVMPGFLAELEANPVVATAAGPVALDGLGRCAGPAVEIAAPRPDKIDRLLYPRSVAVMGVSERMNPGRMILDNILAAGFPASDMVVVKPDSNAVAGCRTVPDLGSLESPVDLLIVAVAAPAVPGVMEQVVELRAAESVIVIPGGLGERRGTDDLAAAVADSIAAARRTDWGGPVVVGPNSMGVQSGPGRIDATFIPSDRMTPAESTEQPVAIVAQSGAFTLSRLDRNPQLRPRYLVTIGNQLDLTVGDHLEYFAADPEVSVVGCYVEGLVPGDGTRLVDAAAAIGSRGGCVVLARGGRTSTGAQAASTHTAAIATDDLVTRQLAKRAGILEAETLDEFEDLLRLALAFRGRLRGGRRVAALSNAGFECVAMADAVGPLEAAAFDSGTHDRLTGILGAGRLDGIVGVQNPLDLTPVAGDEIFAAAVETVLDDPGVDLAVIGCVPYTPALLTLPDDVGAEDSVVQRLASLAGHPTPWVMVVDGGHRYDPMVAVLESAGLVVFRTADRAMRLLGRYATRHLPHLDE